MTLVNAATQAKDFCLAYRKGSLHLKKLIITATKFKPQCFVHNENGVT